jgi:type II secretory pathway pseudopilin PulG
MFCNQCGQQNPDEAASCAQCGNPLTTLFPVQPTSAPSDGSAAAVAPAVYTHEQPTAPPPATVLPPVEPKTDGKAVASLIFGIVGVLTAIVLIGIVLGIPAVILGHMSRSNIKKSMGQLKGAGMALAGLIMGYISLAGVLVLPFILIVAAIAIPNLLKARTAANEATAVASVHSIVAASAAYQATKGSYPITLDQLRDANLIDPTLAVGLKSGYRISLEGTGEHFFVDAVPVTTPTTGTRSFCGAEDDVIHYTTGNQPCTLESAVLQ